MHFVGPNVVRLNVVRPNVVRPYVVRPNVVRPNVVRPNVVRPNVVRPYVDYFRTSEICSQRCTLVTIVLKRYSSASSDSHYVAIEHKVNMKM